MNTETYKVLMGFACMNPDCKFGYEIQTHHIAKQRLGGPDEAWNYIALCIKCHKRLENSKNSIALFIYKGMAEIKKYGFVFDERNLESGTRLQGLLDQRGLQGVGFIPPDNPKAHSPFGPEAENDRKNNSAEKIMAYKNRASEYRKQFEAVGKETSIGEVGKVVKKDGRGGSRPGGGRPRRNEGVLYLRMKKDVIKALKSSPKKKEDLRNFAEWLARYPGDPTSSWPKVPEHLALGPTAPSPLPASPAPAR